MKKELIERIISLLDKTSERHLKYVYTLLLTFEERGDKV